MVACTSDKKLEHKEKIKRCLKVSEVLFLLCAEFAVAGLFIIPTVYYALPDIMEEEPTLGQKACTQVVPYSGLSCSSELMTLQECFSGMSSQPLIPSAIDQQQGERGVTTLLRGLELPILNPSPECLERIRPFLCLHVFSLCDTSNNLHVTQRGECLRLRDNLCSDEWMTAVRLLPPGTLPVCEDLPNEFDKCTEINSTQDFPPSLTNVSLEEPLNCNQGFFHDMNDTGLCRPECGQFLHIGFGLLIFERFSISLSLIAAVTMFILALTVQRDKLLVFPQILVVYMSGTAFVFGVSLMIGFIDNTKLFCGSQDYIYSIGSGNETAYCTFTGVATSYFLEQICVWTALHATFLFWAIGFPFSYRQLQISGKIHYAHIISVLLALCSPLPSALIPLKDGYFSFRNPTLGCIGRNTQFIYYLLVLPISILLGITSGVLVLTFWIIFREFVLKKLIAGKKVSEVGKAEIKIAMVLVYYTFVGVMGLVSFTVSDHQDHIIADRIRELILCESTGTKCVM